MQILEMILSVDGEESRVWQGNQAGVVLGYYDAAGDPVTLPKVYEMACATGDPVAVPWAT